MGAISNFSFLAAQDKQLARLGALAERYFFDDAPSTLIKLRQLAEFIAKDVAARHGLLPAQTATFDDVLRTLKVKAVLPREIADLFFHLKKHGNAAVHENVGTAAQALTALKIARAAAIWFHQSYGGAPGFKPGPFVPPAEPVDSSAALTAEIETLRAQVRASADSEAKALLAYQEAEGARLQAIEAAEARQQEREFWENYAAETEAGLRQAEADLKAAEAALQSAKITLGYARINSPIAGRIGKSAVTVGALVTANQPTALATVQQFDPMYVDVTQSASELLQLRRELEAGTLSAAENVPVTILLEDGSRYSHPGKLTFADLSVDPGTGSVTLRAVFPNPRHGLLPGMFVRAEIAAGTRENAILAPQRGVTRNQRGEPTALVVGPDNVVELRTLEVERTLGNRWLVSKGLSAGDRVIVEGQQKVRPGAEVKPVEIETGKAASDD